MSKKKIKKIPYEMQLQHRNIKCQDAPNCIANIQLVYKAVHYSYLLGYYQLWLNYPAKEKIAD